MHATPHHTVSEPCERRGGGAQRGGGSHRKAATLFGNGALAGGNGALAGGGRPAGADGGRRDGGARGGDADRAAHACARPLSPPHVRTCARGPSTERAGAYRPQGWGGGGCRRW
eukprot:365478-Rhodomonas_salina.2